MGEQVEIMSNPTIKKTLQLRLSVIDPPIPTTWENTQNKQPNAPYQRVFFIPAQPDTHAISDHVHSRLSGVMQVSLYFKVGQGSKDMDERVVLIRECFEAGLSIVDSGWQVIIPRLPSQSAAQVTDDGYVSHVSIFYEAYQI